MKSYLNKYRKLYFLIPIIFVIVVKIPHLFLPYFWDEAWSYFPAVFKMYETGPGILPGALPLWDAKGHPLFFFFISSAWMRIVGTNVAMVHILPLLITCGVLISVFFTTKRIAGETSANIAVTLLAVQSLFLAQATMLLPEMLIGLFLILLINTYLSNRFILFSLLGSMMVLTKETSIIFILTFAFFHLLAYLKPGKESRKYITETIFIIIPLFVYAIFLILHKKEFGSFFFEDHLGYIKLSWPVIKHKLNIVLSNLFISYGRILITIAVLAAIILIFIKKIKIRHKKAIALIFSLILFFTLFSVLNFYTERYILGLLVIFTVVAGIILPQVKFKQVYLNLILICIITFVPLYYSFTKKTNADSNLGYVETVKVHQQMVKYCEEQGWQDKKIAASFNMIFCLRNPHLGYIEGDKGFSNVGNIKSYDSSDILIIESTNYEGHDIIEKAKINDKLIKRFTDKHAWGEIFEKK